MAGPSVSCRTSRSPIYQANRRGASSFTESLKCALALGSRVFHLLFEKLVKVIAAVSFHVDHGTEVREPSHAVRCSPVPSLLPKVIDAEVVGEHRLCEIPQVETRDEMLSSGWVCHGVVPSPPIARQLAASSH